MPIDEDVHSLATAANYAALTTLFSDGSPQTNMMWVDSDGERLIVNTETTRAKFRNVRRDPRVAVAIWDREDPHRYVEARGRVVDTVEGQAAHDHLDEVSIKYRGKPYDPDKAHNRVMLLIEVDRVLKRNI